jgi:hypothetical protein
MDENSFVTTELQGSEYLLSQARTVIREFSADSDAVKVVMTTGKLEEVYNNKALYSCHGGQLQGCGQPDARSAYACAA